MTSKSTSNPELRQLDSQVVHKTAECSTPCRDCPNLEGCAEACPLAKISIVVWRSHPLLGGFLIMELLLLIKYLPISIDLSSNAKILFNL